MQPSIGPIALRIFKVILTRAATQYHLQHTIIIIIIVVVFLAGSMVGVVIGTTPLVAHVVFVYYMPCRSHLPYWPHS